MTTTKREPLLRDSDLAVGMKIGVNRRMTLSEVRDYYEAARSKDAELIQELVDGLKHAQRFAEEYGYGPLQTVEWDLDAAAAAGFKPSEP